VEFSSETIVPADGIAIPNESWTQELATINTGITMSITPYITEDKKYVLLRIITNLNSLLELRKGTTYAGTSVGERIFDTYELPEIQYTTLMTRVSVPDQGNIMLGGLTLTAEKETEAGVPILSKIPIINRLFSNRSEVKDKEILIVLVKPTIMLREETEEDAIAAMK
jgi:type II secretory pathway component GspD/PulD (secretin)